MSRARLTPYLLLGVLMLGTGLGIGLGLAQGAPRLPNSGLGPVTTTTDALSAPHWIATTQWMTVSQQTGLSNGEIVTVKVGGFPPGKAFLSECASANDVSYLGCGQQLAGQPFAVIENGAGTAPLVISSQAAIGSLTTSTVPCGSSCVLVATSGVGPNRALVQVPLRFG